MENAMKNHSSMRFPVIFDPGQSGTLHPEKISGLDTKNLGAINIRELADSTHAIPWAVSGRGDLEEELKTNVDVRFKPVSVDTGVGPSKSSVDVGVEPITTGPEFGFSKTPGEKIEGEGGQAKDTLIEVGYGSNLNEKLFHISRGSPKETWFKFKRFDYLSLLNLCHYQDRLVQLEREIYECQGDIIPDKVKALADMLREYRKHPGKSPRVLSIATCLYKLPMQIRPSKRLKRYLKCRGLSLAPRDPSLSCSLR
jgi:hypothetical protein